MKISTTVLTGSALVGLLATARETADVTWPGRTRPLCPYSRTATGRGSGDIGDAANFACR